MVLGWIRGLGLRSGAMRQCQEPSFFLLAILRLESILSWIKHNEALNVFEKKKKQKTKKKFYSSLKDLPDGSFYFFAVDKKDNQTMIGYVNPDPERQLHRLGSVSRRS